ncbi:MAG: glycoside hydrolase family 15 protein, partial [Chloroflexota bacterium]|nr:glycoside hydrolase family 15 protein [Chloroflexota bacterium]
EFDCAYEGNIALMGELDLSQGQEFTLALAFGQSFHDAVSTLSEALSIPFGEQREQFVDEWRRVCHPEETLEKVAGDGGQLYHRSESVLLAHEDKLYPGAVIASMSIPWGQVKVGKEAMGGYHLVWTRDLVKSVTGLLATDNTDAARRALIYLSTTQEPDGGYHQNFWVNGEPYWQGVQLDVVAYPILLAWRLHTMQALKEFDPYPMVRKAAGYLVRNGPATPQDRWEEVSGYTPATLATNIAALICASTLARQRGDQTTADFLQEYADFLESHVEAWTVTTEGSLIPEISRHYIRINPVDIGNPHPDENPNEGTVHIPNRPPDTQSAFPAKDIVDAGFLELVRYGVRKPGNPLIEDSLKVVDAVLKVDTPFGPCWHRYNHDGYGQRPDGGPFDGWGKGRAWPLLTGERGHYELAAGRPVDPFIQAMEGFAAGTGMLPEQVWDEADRPEQGLFLGRPTSAAMPLAWAHGEYMRLLRSAADGQIFDFIPEVAERYWQDGNRKLLEVWKPNRQVRQIKAGWTLRVQAPATFHLHWTQNEWQDVQETRSTATALGVEFVDVEIAPEQRAPVRFTFRWDETDRWEGQDYVVTVDQERAGGE